MSGVNGRLSFQLHFYEENNSSFRKELKMMEMLWDKIISYHTNCAVSVGWASRYFITEVSR